MKKSTLPIKVEIVLNTNAEVELFLTNQVPKYRALDFRTIRKLLDCLPKLYFYSYAHDFKMPFEKFVEAVIQTNNNCYTYFADTNTQQDTGKYRSLVDIYRICSFYYPKVNFKDVMKAVQTNVKIGSQLCSTVRRRVYYITSNSPESRNASASSVDEFGRKLGEYES